jgi:Subtilase family
MAGLGLLILFHSGATSYAGVPDIIGITVLRATTTNLDGTGVRVAQVEAQLTPGNADWEVTPSATGIGLPASSFTWYSTNASTNSFPNSLGIDSWHADMVGGYFYGLPGGVSTNVSHIDNYEADDFLSDRLPFLTPINARVVNQCFNGISSEMVALDTLYDNFAAQNNTLFITSVGDRPGGNPTVLPPATCYNGIGVSAYYNTNATSIGPTSDGRAKPDITAPQSPTSISTPLVSGGAAILQGAGIRGDGGADTNSATDARTLKALLLNGAIKPPTWANPSPSPLDPLYGAGILDVFESYRQLAGGKHGYIATSTVATNAPHPPTAATGNVSSLVGWDFNAITNSAITDAINHYCFSVTNSAGNSPFTGTMTLVWNRHYTTATINNLDLFLYNMKNGSLIASSISQVDNVEHIYVPQLPAGRYDLEVVKHGGAIANFITAPETYALAFEFFSVQLSITPVTGGLLVSWPVYPDGFQLQSSSSLASPSWNYVATTVTNGQNCALVGIGGAGDFFRLFRNP